MYIGYKHEAARLVQNENFDMIDAARKVRDVHNLSSADEGDILIHLQELFAPPPRKRRRRFKFRHAAR